MCIHGPIMYFSHIHILKRIYFLLKQTTRECQGSRLTLACTENKFFYKNPKTLLENIVGEVHKDKWRHIRSVFLQVLPELHSWWSFTCLTESIDSEDWNLQSTHWSWETFRFLWAKINEKQNDKRNCSSGMVWIYEMYAMNQISHKLFGTFE